MARQRGRTTEARVKNRIKAHKRVKAKDLIPNELNPRLHPESQKAALQALYEEIGFARSLLAYELPDGRLKLIDGHLRQSMDPEMEVEVEILDVTDEEAKKLLLSIDPLASLAEYDSAQLEKLQGLVNTESAVLANMWSRIGLQDEQALQELEDVSEDDEGKFGAGSGEAIPEQWLVLVECRDETHQKDVLRWIKGEGLKAKALIS